MDYEPFIEVARERSSTDPAHDFLHVLRVLDNARVITEKISADVDVITTAILLHELFNYPKGHPQSKYSGDICAEQADEVLKMYQFPAEKRGQVLECIRFHSFSRGVVPQNIEGKIVQDADRLDAIGAIGIARLFATCANMERPFYHVTDPFAENRKLNDGEYGLDHFFTKLFRLVDGMHTASAREIALQRTEFMRGYIQQLRQEVGW